MAKKKIDDVEPALSPPRGPRDNRKIVRGVQLMVGKDLVTFAGDEAEVHDDLEAHMTPDQCDRLMVSGAIEGEWKPTGEPGPPMKGSPMAKAELKPADTRAQIDRLQRELAELRQENEMLMAAQTEPAAE